MEVIIHFYSVLIFLFNYFSDVCGSGGKSTLLGETPFLIRKENYSSNIESDVFSEEIIIIWSETIIRWSIPVRLTPNICTVLPQ